MKVIFLDRDGVINKYPGDTKYVTKIKDFHFLPGALLAIKKLTQANFKIFIISNQAGVTKGIFTKHELDKITKFMLEKIRKHCGKISKVFYCIHRQEDNCNCRKPKTGSIKKALNFLGASLKDVKSSYFVGDTILDMETGRMAGCSTILVLSGKEKNKSKSKWSVQPDFVAKNLLEATKIIINENPNPLCFSRTRT